MISTPFQGRKPKLWRHHLQRYLQHRLKRIPRLQHICLLCAEPGQQRICHECQPYLDKARHSCQQCALPLRHHALKCGECLKHPPAFEHTLASFLYVAPVNKLIHQFKEERDFVAGQALADLMAQDIRRQQSSRHLVKPDLLVPVPSHWRPQWRRGYNPAGLLSEQLGKQLGITELRGIKKTAAPAEQKSLKRKEREQNLRNAFKIKGDDLKGKTVAIVDDVMTTGATVNSLARELKRAGAKTVNVWVLARTPLYSLS